VTESTLKEVDVTAAKKAAAPTPKRTATAKKSASASKSAVSATKKAPPVKKSAPTTKRPTPVKKKAVAKKGGPVATKKAPPAVKKAPSAKRSAPPAKATAKVSSAKKGAAGLKRSPSSLKVPRGPTPPKRLTVGPYAKESKFLDEQRVLLLEERGIYDGQAHDLRAEADSLALEREPGDVQFDEESGEGGTVTVDRERNLALSAQASAAVEEIDDAMRKIERKSYGACERCHQAIPKARLRALPFARLCVACKSGGLARR
jgi:DnaK suppressor protein